MQSKGHLGTLFDASVYRCSINVAKTLSFDEISKVASSL